MYSICKRGFNSSLCVKTYLAEERTAHANSLNVNVILFYFPDSQLLLTHPNQFEKLVKFHLIIMMMD